MTANFVETQIDLIRHGEPEGGQKLRGTLDDPLSELGWSQMWESVGEYDKWDAIFTSPLQRCHHFASSLSERHGLNLTIESGFREIAFGEWEGLTSSDVIKRYPGALERYWKEPASNTPPNGEPLSDFMARIRLAWEQMLLRVQGQKVLLVCHGGVIRAILTEVLGMPDENMWKFDVPYANLTRIVYHHFDDGSAVGQMRFHQRRMIL